ncbi:MAG TPA: hypothetical protein RMG45_23395, partial [Polyangiaceae bacterium LLY-WYZ-15_(1-7)]|nr:hypothetical protein [Polyangiaceae bacterium LLY-WYZ-15_(1-7)]
GVLDAAAARGGPDVRLALRVDGRPVDAIEAGAEPGYATFAWTIPPSDAPRRVTFRVSAPEDGARHFCWGATLFAEEPAE